MPDKKGACGAGAAPQIQRHGQGILAGASQSAVRMSILPWRAWRSWPVTNAHGTKPPGENLAIDRVAITDDVLRRPFPAAGFGDLPGNPFGGRVCCHSEP